MGRPAGAPFMLIKNPEKLRKRTLRERIYEEIVRLILAAGVASDDTRNGAATTCTVFIVRFLGYGFRSKSAEVSSLGRRLVSFGRRLCLPDQEPAGIWMGEYRRRAVGDDRPERTRVWLWFLPRPAQAWRALL